MISVSMYVVEFNFNGQEVRTVSSPSLSAVIRLLTSTFQMIDADDRVTIEAILAVDSQRIGVANEVIKVPVFCGGQVMIERIVNNPDLLIKLD